MNFCSNAVVALGFLTDGFDTLLRDINFHVLMSKQLFSLHSYWILQKIEGFENHPQKIDGFGRIQKTYANATIAHCTLLAWEGYQKS